MDINGEYDDLMTPSFGEDNTLSTQVSKNAPDEKPKQESVTVFESIPSSVMNHIKSVSYPPTKQTRFSLATAELEHDLEKRIKKVNPCARIEFKPNKAEVADVTIIEGNKEEKNDECDLPNRRIGCMNFIHQDRPKEGSTSKKYIEVMFFNFDKREEYERIKPIVVDFFKEMDTDRTAPQSYPSSLQNDMLLNDSIMNQRIQGGKRLKKTQKKKRQSTSVKKNRSKSRHRRGRK